jgi:hypothetical protein
MRGELMADRDPDVNEPAVRALIAAINAGDQQAFFAALTPDTTMSDDGTDRNLAEWADREIFPPTASRFETGQT